MAFQGLAMNRVIILLMGYFNQTCIRLPTLAHFILVLASLGISSSSCSAQPDGRIGKVLREDHRHGITARLVSFNLADQSQNNLPYAYHRALNHELRMRYSQMSDVPAALGSSWWGIEPQYAVFAAVTPQLATYYLLPITHQDAAIIIGNGADAHVELCEITINRDEFPRELLLSNSFVAAEIGTGANCSLDAFDKPAIRQDLATKPNLAGYSITEKKSFVKNALTVTVSVIEREPKYDMVNSAEATAFVLGANNLAQYLEITDYDIWRIGYALGRDGREALVMRAQDSIDGQSLCVFENLGWPTQLKSDRDRFWPLPEAEAAEMEYCQTALKRSHDRRIKEIMEAVRRNPPTTSPITAATPSEN